MTLMCIDPGTTQSAWVLYDEQHGEPLAFGKDDNALVLQRIYSTRNDVTVVIEEIRSYGMAVGREVFETAKWTGRFEEMAQPRKVAWVGRIEVKSHLCHSARANDSNITAAIADRFGGSVKAAKGTKAEPGPLHGIAGDMWAALGVAITYAETRIPSNCPTCAGLGCGECCNTGA